MKKVVKFGGSSLASAEQFKKVGNIIRKEESRRYVIPSAPGKRTPDDTKVTDMLYSCYGQAILGEDAERDFEEQLEAIKAHLEAGKMARSFEVPDDEDAEIWFKGYNLLTAKPTIYAANVAEDDLADDGASNPHVAKVREMAKEEGAEVFVICAQIEQELAELDEDEKKEYLEDLGVESSGLDKLVAASYSLLGLISFLTAGEDECRAWTIKKGTKAPQAAGKIHTDFERGFIKAEVVNYQDLLDNGSLSAAREKGIVGMEGKDYVVKDGDVILFRFNV